MGKKLIGMLLVWALAALCLPFSAAAQVVDSGPFPVVDAGSEAGGTIHVLALGEAFQKLPGTSYDTAMVYYIKNAVESPRVTRCPITWDFGQIDSTAPGFFTLDGLVQLTEPLVPDKSVYPDGAVTVPLHYYVYDPRDPGTKLAIQLVFFDDDLQYSMNRGGDVAQLDLPKEAYGAFFYKGFHQLVDCGVVWDYDSFDSSKPGKQTLYGDILPPKAFRVGDSMETGEPLRAECTVVVSDVQVPAQTRVIYGYGYKTSGHRVIPLGMDAAALGASFAKRLDPGLKFQFTTEDKANFSCGYQVDTTKIDTSQIGVYYPLNLTGFPSHCIFDQAVKDMAAVYVVDPNEVDLRCTQYYPSTGKLDVNWIYAAVAPTLWAKVDAGAWAPVDNTIYGAYSQPGNGGAQGMYMRLGLLDPGHQYEFEVRYDAGSYSANTLVVDLTGGAPFIYDTPIDGDRHGYDRDDGGTGSSGGGTPGDGNTGNSGGGTPGDGDTGNSPPPPPAQPKSVTIGEAQLPAAEKSAVPLENSPVAAVQTDLVAQPGPPSSEDITPPPAQNALQTPAENTAARREPVSAALPMVLGGGGLACAAALLWRRKRVKP